MKMKTLAIFSLYILAACFMGCCISGIYICFLSSFEVPPRKTFESEIEIREDICAIWGSNCTPKRPAFSIFVDLKRELLAERDQDGKNHYLFLHPRKTIRKKKRDNKQAHRQVVSCVSFFVSGEHWSRLKYLEYSENNQQINERLSQTWSPYKTNIYKSNVAADKLGPRSCAI